MKIAVTGIGIVCAIGNNAAEVQNSLENRKSGIAPVQYLDTIHKDLLVGEVKLSNDEMKSMLGVDCNEDISRTALIGALALRQAVKDAKVDPDSKVTFINGTTVGGMDMTEQVFEKYLHQSNDSSNPKVIQVLRKHDCGSSSFETARLAGLVNADVCTCSTACSSALNAIILGCEMLKSGKSDVVIAGGAESLSKFHLNGFNTLMILDSKRCRPFSDDRAGLNLGEGAAYVVMRRADIDEESPYAYIAGYGVACDAFHQTATSDNGEGAYLAMSEALEMAKQKPSDIDYINAHGTGTPNNDATEKQAMIRIFGNELPAFSSTKAYTGHTTSASGSIEAIISILAMHHPEILNLHKTPYKVMCNSFGFGGNDSSLIMSTLDSTLSTQDCTSFTLNSILSSVNNDEQLKEIKEFVSPMEARRMGKLLKGAILTSMKVLKDAGIEKPDAIITATKFGMLENSERFLMDMCQNGESLLKPTLFMQSTHNTLGSAVAIRLNCHGYNMTYSQGDDSLKWAEWDAQRLIATGKAKTVLIINADEITPLLGEIFGCESGFFVKSKLIVSNV